MLVWEEDVKPAKVHTASPTQNMISAARTASVSPALAVVPAHSAPQVAPTSAADSVPTTPPTMRRVNAADKRIINGKTDVNQLVPF